MIDNREIEFNPPETPNVITAPMPKHDKGISSINDVLYMATISELVTPLPIIKKNLLHAGLFSGYTEKCYCCAAQPNGCKLLKEGIQSLMENHIILIEKVPPAKNLCQDLSVISGPKVRITSKGPVRIIANPKVAPLIITTPRHIPYSSDKAIPLNYGSNIYYQGVK